MAALKQSNELLETAKASDEVDKGKGKEAADSPLADGTACYAPKGMDEDATEPLPSTQVKA